MIRRSAASSSEGKRWPNDRRIPDVLDDLLSLFPRVSKATAGTLNADLVHRHFEELAILADFDGVDVGTDQLNAVLVEPEIFAKMEL